MKLPFTKRDALMFVMSLLIICVTFAKAQGLQIGDKIPDIEIKRILNYKSETERLKNFIGNKSFLIDFWFAQCTACFESFPKLDSIQKEFKDDLNILLVTFETKETTINIFNKIKRVSHVKLPSAVSDTLLALLFPHHSAPHEIWVDKNGVIKAITDHREISRENIRALIAGNNLNLPIKKDNMEYSAAMPLIKTLDVNRTLKYSFLSSYQPGISASLGIYVDHETEFLKAIVENSGIRNLYIVAYEQFGKDFNQSRMIIDEMVLERFKQSNDSLNVFCYEKWWRDTSRAKAYIEMQRDLDAFFSLKSHTTKRNVPCIILKETGFAKRYKSIDKSERADTYSRNDTLFLKNVYLKYPIENLLNYGRFAWSPFQFIDETGYIGKMTIQLPETFETIAQVNLYLKNYDLEVNIEDRLLDVIVIKEVEKS